MATVFLTFSPETLPMASGYEGMPNQLLKTINYSSISIVVQIK